MRDHRLGEFPGTVFALVARVFGAAPPLLAIGSGLICSPTTTKRLALLPGGSQVISVAVAVFSAGPSTEVSVGDTTAFL